MTGTQISTQNARMAKILVLVRLPDSINHYLNFLSLFSFQRGMQ